MRTKHDALRDTVTAVDRAYKADDEDEVEAQLDHALHLLLLVQAFEEADGEHQETIRGAIEHAPGEPSE